MVMEVWTEKYRPKRLEDVVNQKHVVERLKSWVSKDSVPNMLFAGPAGVGKTTIALCLAKELFKDNWRENFMEMNASDERGINIVRGAIKDFARVKPIGSDFKIIFLDESDALTPEAQEALRRTIEKYSGVTRFILSANYSSRLIEPIQSRMAVFRFSRLKKEDVLLYLSRIVEGEGIEATPEALAAIVELSEGDLRRSTNLLQTSSALGKVTPESVYDVASQARPQDIKDMMELALAGNFPEARKKLSELLINQGLSGDDIIREMHRQIFNVNVPDLHKLALIEKTGETEFRLNQGGSEDIQLEALLAYMARTKA